MFNDNKTLTSDRQSEHGASLLEMLLTVSLIAMVMVGVAQLIHKIGEDAVAETTADFYKNVRMAAVDFISGPDGFDTIYTAVNASGGVLQLPLTGVGLSLDDGGVLNPDTTGSAPIGGDVSVIYRIVDGGAGVGQPREMEIYILSNDRVQDERLRNAANIMGAYGGYVSALQVGAQCIGNCEDTIRGAFGDWRVDLGTIGATPWAANPQASTDDGGYLAQYAYVNSEEVFGDYLYRTQQQDSDRHRMHTALNLGNRNLVGVDNATLNGDLNVRRDMILQGGAHIQGNIAISGDAIVEEDMAVTSLGIGNDLVVESQMTAPTMTTTNFVGTDANLDVLNTASLRTGAITTNILDATGSDAGAFFNSIQGNSLQIDEELTGVIIGGDGLDIAAGNMEATTVDISGGGSMNVTGSSTITNFTTQETHIQNLVDCAEGC